MSKRVFSAPALARVIRAGDSNRFGVDLKNHRQSILQAAADEANAGAVDLANHQRGTVKNKPCITYQSFHAHLVLRAVTRHLQKRFNIALPNRDQIVRGVIETLMDSTPIFIMRRDISSFYESIPTDNIRQRLLFDTASSQTIRKYLKQYFDAHCPAGGVGLPRGVGLSSLLAEMAMEGFDQSVRAIPGVYKYYRFSDDIIIFSYLPLEIVKSDIEKCIFGGMQFSPLKREDIALDETARTSARSIEFEYLGYNFCRTNLCGDKDGRQVVVSISDRKIRKLKSRIYLSLKSFGKNRNFPLLRDRIAYASSNFSVRRQGFAFFGRPSHVKSGIYYNYRQCGTYQFKNSKMVVGSHAGLEIRKLDDYWFSLLKSRGSPFRLTLDRHLSPPQLDALARHSFLAGFNGRMTVRFRPERVRAIKAIWLHV